jgi:hypothetical protein
MVDLLFAERNYLAGSRLSKEAAMTKVLHRIGWIGLTLVGALMVFAVVSDLTADHRTGLPTDHAGTFTKLAGRPFAEVTASSPGIAHYVTNLEVGYALHELTFAALFLALVLVPLRRRDPWAWWTAWAVMIGNLGYTFTFGRHDSTILGRSVIADVAVPVFLMLCAPAVFGLASRAADGTDAATPMASPAT